MSNNDRLRKIESGTLPYNIMVCFFYGNYFLFSYLYVPSEGKAIFPNTRSENKNLKNTEGYYSEREIDKRERLKRILS